MGLIDDINNACDGIERRIAELQVGLTKTSQYQSRAKMLLKLRQASLGGMVSLPEKEIKTLLEEASWLGKQPSCSGGKQSCDKPAIRKFDFTDRGTWFVCEGHYEEVLEFIKTNKYVGVYDLDVDEPDIPHLSINYCIPALSFTIIFRDHIRGTNKYGYEKTEFDLVLKKVGLNRISVLKGLRAITGAPLIEAKRWADSPPQTIKKGMTKWDAEEAKKLLEDAGATVEIR